jgi:gas vesicle structural protein
MAVARRSGGGYLERPRPSGLADVIDIVLDKGLVVDAYVRVALLGIELLTVDARIVIASVDTYLRFAEAVGRLDIAATGAESVPELLETGRERTYKAITKGAIDGVMEGLTGRSQRKD